MFKIKYFANYINLIYLEKDRKRDYIEIYTYN